MTPRKAGLRHRLLNRVGKDTEELMKKPKITVIHGGIRLKQQNTYLCNVVLFPEMIISGNVSGNVINYNNFL